MATIQQRGKGYRVRVSCGYNSAGKQIIKSFTWVPPYGFPARQIQKELTRQVVLFEEKCRAEIVSDKMLFKDFVKIRKEEYCKSALKQSTIANYSSFEKVTAAVAGDLPMCEITTRFRVRNKTATS